LRVFQQQAAGIGQSDGAAFPVEQGLPEFFLELPDLSAEGRLGDAEYPCRSREIALSRDGKKIVEVAQFHDHTY